MPGSVKKTHKNGFHPEVVARIFNVHVRTVFRFFKRGFLKTVGASKLADKSDVLQILANLKNSCSTKEAQVELNTKKRTVQYWKSVGLLQEITVLGTRRIQLSHLHALVKLRNQTSAKRLWGKWRSLKEVKRILNTTVKDTAPNFGKTKKTVVKTKRKIAAPPQQNSGSVKKTKIKRQPTQAVIVLYKPKTRLEKEVVRTKRLVTSENAKRYLGYPVPEHLRHEEVDGQILYYAHAVETYKS